MLSQIETAITQARDEAGLEEVRLAWLGKSGVISTALKTLGKLPPAERKTRGQELNQLKQQAVSLWQKRKDELAQERLEAQLQSEKEDVTLPSRPEPQGSVHPISQTMDELAIIFAEMGFFVAEGPDIESDFYNFTALNIPPDHPARQMHDTFYLPSAPDGSERVLRTHTSPVQIRTLEKQKPPLRMVAMGRTYRSDYDVTHTPMFHQIEALVIDEATHMGHLKACLLDFCRRFFGISDLPLRFRPSFFPFTEPSAEVDIGCRREKNRLVLGNHGDWLEILGCGMVHPNVLRAAGVDPEKYQGFAFGMGVERLAMLKYGISDLRKFFEGDMRWLHHYGFAGFWLPDRILGNGL